MNYKLEYICECGASDRWTIKSGIITCGDCGHSYRVSGLPSPDDFNHLRKQLLKVDIGIEGGRR